MRLGFQQPSPFERVQHTRYPEPNWIVTVRRRGERTFYSTTDARAYFSEDNPASHYVEHPGDISIFARLHLALAVKKDRQVLTAAEVAELIGDNT